mgnify:CR=1 FL=1
MLFLMADTCKAVRTVRRCAGVGWLGLLAQVAWAQAPLVLQDSMQLQESLSPQVRASLPTFVSGARISGRTDLETVVDGDAMLRKGDLVIQADRLEYQQSSDLARARGHVRINRAGNVYEGPLLELKVDAFEGFFNEPSYHFQRNDAHGQADRVDFLDASRSVIHNASFTTCKRRPGPDWMPDWILKAGTISMDSEDDVGTAQDVLLSFKGVPVLPLPYLSFPLSEQRKSGLLPPTIGLDNVNGFELAQPYYWNIAPNRDLTLTPTLMSKRGVNLGSEFRYLESNYSGIAKLDWMPTDHLRDSRRWAAKLNHQGQFDSRWADEGIGLKLNLNRVSDDDYWRDFSRANAQSTQRLLANDLALTWQSGAFSNSVRTQRWQTLQDINAPIVPPYDRMPQLSTRYTHNDAHGLDVALDLDYTQFQSSTVLTGQPNAQRLFSQLQVSRPWVGSAGFFTPKVQLHATSYQFDAALTNGANQASRVVPTLSLDSGLVFERESQWFGRQLTQTLEPRAFYVNTPYRDQSLLPNYDSGVYDFNLATIYAPNAFVGNDRISDSNLLTLGVISRFLDPDSGVEAARLGLAQRLRFKDQLVTLPGGTASDGRVSDLLLAGSVNWDPRWTFDANVQVNPSSNRSERSVVGARYSPGSYRTVSAAYRFQRDLSEQVDLAWQWPLNDLWGDRSLAAAPGQGLGDGHWYSVGRLNFSMSDGKLVNSVLGFEYDAGCWLGRIVLERLQTSTATATQRIMFQLEFAGFTRLGVNPLQSLKGNIPNYQNLREPGAAPSRFSNYD